MQTLNLTDVPQTGIVPNVKRQRARVRVISAKPGKTKKEETKFDLGLEFFSPEKIVDLDKKTIVLAGLKTTLSLIFEGKGAPGTAQFHQKMGLPLNVEAENEEEFNSKMQEIYMGNNLAFEAFFSTEEMDITEHNPETGEKMPAIGEDGQPIKGGFRWSTLWANDVVGKVQDPAAM